MVNLIVAINLYKQMKQYFVYKCRQSNVTPGTPLQAFSRQMALFITLAFYKVAKGITNSTVCVHNAFMDFVEHLCDPSLKKNELHYLALNGLIY